MNEKIAVRLVPINDNYIVTLCGINNEIHSHNI